MIVTITTASPDRRMSTPATLKTLESTLTTATAREFIDAAAWAIARELRYEPWRQVYSLQLRGTGTTVLPVGRKPIEAVTAVTDVDGTAYTDYTVTCNGLGIADRLERNGGWGKLFDGTIGTSGVPYAESERDFWVVAGTIGWLMPGQVSTWAASTAYIKELASTSYDDSAGTEYTLGSWVRATDARVQLRFECTSAGTSGATEPAAFLTASAGDTITDNSLTWTARAASELPADLQEATIHLALHLERQRDRDLAIKSEASEGTRVTYADQMPKAIMTMIGQYR